MHALSVFTLAASALTLATPAFAQATFYEREGFQGRSFTAEGPVANLERSGLNDRAESVVVTSNRWEVCEDTGYGGRCVVLRPGQYPALSAMGLSDSVSSVRMLPRNANIDDQRYAPPPVVNNDYRRRHNERLYEADVTSVRAVVGTPEQRCWIEREQVPQARSEANVPGAIFGAVLGGVLGHQIGGGTGRDIATVGGAVAGAAVGANVGRDQGGQQMGSRDVQRCENVSDTAHPDYWDVTYNFRGQEHRAQLKSEPGRTLAVNEQGEPRD